MMKFQEKIEICISRNSCSEFLVRLLKLVDCSIDNLSLENECFLNYIIMFESIDNGLEEKYWGLDFSKCFYKLIDLNYYQLELLYDFMSYIEENLSDEDMDLCRDELCRGKRDIEWLLQVECFYRCLKKIQSNVELSQYEIIRSNLKGSCFVQEKYFTDLLQKTPWDEIQQDKLLGFLQGYDFQYLSDKAYFFVLPACMKLCIDMFREENSHSPTEQMSFFLRDKSRAAIANSEDKKLINDFIQLLSHKPYYLLSFYGYNLDELIQIWCV